MNLDGRRKRTRMTFGKTAKTRKQSYSLQRTAQISKSSKACKPIDRQQPINREPSGQKPHGCIIHSDDYTSVLSEIIRTLFIQDIRCKSVKRIIRADERRERNGNQNIYPYTPSRRQMTGSDFSRSQRRLLRSHSWIPRRERRTQRPGKDHSKTPRGAELRENTELSTLRERKTEFRQL